MLTHRFSHSLNRVVLLTLTGLCTVLTGSINAASIAKPTLITQEVSSQEGRFFEGFIQGHFLDSRDRHKLEGVAGQTLTCRVTSNQFDTVIELVDSNRTSLAYNDDYLLGSTNSYIEVRLPKTGPYILIVSRFRDRGAGRYEGVCINSPNSYT